MTKRALVFILATVLIGFLATLSFSPVVLAGFHRNLENGLSSGLPGAYRKAPQTYQVGNNFFVSDWLNNGTGNDITDNFWVEIWRVNKCERSSGTIEVTSGNPALTEDDLDKCSGGTLERVGRTQQRWFVQNKHTETVRQGRSLELTGSWKIDKEGYYQFDFFSDSTWSHGPFATGFFRVLPNPSPSPSPSPSASPNPSGSPNPRGSPAPSPSVSPSPNPSASPVPVTTQPQSGMATWIVVTLGLVTVVSGAGFLYMMEHPERKPSSGKRARK